jgi:hypothetical protein
MNIHDFLKTRPTSYFIKKIWKKVLKKKAILKI